MVTTGPGPDVGVDADQAECQAALAGLGVRSLMADVANCFFRQNARPAGPGWTVWSYWG